MKRILFFVSLIIFIPLCLSAQYFTTPQLLLSGTQTAPEINSRTAVLIDAATGALLYSKNPDEEIPPASLTKLMTMHLLFNEIDEGRASYDEIIPVTIESWAQSQPPRSSLMFLAPGQIVTLREIMLGLSISSGNDAAVAAALRVSPSMDAFAELMTDEARRMGLRVTRFVEASGVSEFNITTAQEYTWFCRQYIKLHPQSLKDFHSVPEFSYPKEHNVAPAYRNNPRTIQQFNSNSLLRTFPGVDGLKTGYIDEAGYNMALTAQRDFTRFILIMLGAESTRRREADGNLLLSWAFENFKTVYPVVPEIGRERLWKGKENEVELVLDGELEFTSTTDRANTLNYEIVIPQILIAPLSEKHEAGYMIISDEYGEIKQLPLLTAHSYERGSFFKRLWHSIVLLFRK